MFVVSVESIEYRKLCDRNAIIESWNHSITTFFPRNCIPFNGIRISVTHLSIRDFTAVVKTILIPYSLRVICMKSNDPSWSDTLLDVRAPPEDLEYLVFEFGSGLQSITDSPFAGSRLKSLFFPASVRFICPTGFERCSSVGCVHFGCKSSLRQLGRKVFSELSQSAQLRFPPV
jgi:hypothetical protein